jgi:glutamate racemase
MSKGERLVLEASRNKTIGVFATEFTINSGAHKAAILALAPTACVVPQACPKLVPLIEGEQFSGEELPAAISEYALSLKAAEAATLILSCTHYPFVKKEIEREMGRGVRVIDPAQQTALDAKAAFGADGLVKSEGEGRAVICFSADLRGAKACRRMFKTEECEFSLVSLK